MRNSSKSRPANLLDALEDDDPFYSIELRPPSTDTGAPQTMDAWIDTYHSVRRLTIQGNHVFITDNAVGRPEEENLRHLVTNVGSDAPRTNITPFLTCKHPLDYCLQYAERAYNQGFVTLTVLGGDRHDGVPRCVEHAYALRAMIRRQVPNLILGGWANPHRAAEEQVDHITRGDFAADFYLTQIVSHHSVQEVSRFLEECGRRGLETPGIFGVFYYRSARPKTLKLLGQFFPVPIAELEREFEREKLTPDALCARSIRTLQALGVKRFYISNLPVADAPLRLKRVLEGIAETS